MIGIEGYRRYNISTIIITITIMAITRVQYEGLDKRKGEERIPLKSLFFKS